MNDTDFEFNHCASQVQESTAPHDQAEQSDDRSAEPSSYLPPQIVVIGKANDLVQSYSSGKYSDGYSGYYWER